MDYPHEDFIPWYRRATPGWLGLSAEARGVLVSVCMTLNHRTGAVVLRRGLPSLSMLVAIPWETLEPAIGELVASEKLHWDGSTFTLSDPDFRKRMRMDLSTERVRALRAKRRETDETHETDETRGNDETVNRKEQIRSDQDPPLVPPEGGEPTKKPARSRKKPQTPCPPSDAGEPDVAAWAGTWTLPPEHAEFSRFLDYHRAKGSLFSDWSAAWRTWLRNAEKFKANGRSSSGAASTKQPYDPSAPWLKLPEVG